MDFQIVVIDSHPLTRVGISSLLAHHQIVAAVASFEEAQAVIEKSAPHLAIIDDPWIASKIAAVSPATAVVICSEVIPARIPEGVRAVISKRANPADLVDLFESVLQGAVATPFHHSVVAPQTMLSPREHQVMSMMLAGRRQKEIALDLDISVKTVSTHRFRLLRKMGVESDLALMRFALSNGFA
ncbi:MAG: response regulator transcription factor [Thermoanaerobaculia bacterium]